MNARRVCLLGCLTLVALVALLALLTHVGAPLAGEPQSDAKARVAKRLEQFSVQCRRAFPNVPFMSVPVFLRRSKKAKKAKKQDWVVVDVRTRLERQVSMIPGALSVEQFQGKLEAYKGKSVLVYCTIGWRSGAYTAYLRKKGLAAFNLDGGVLAWAQAGKDFVAPDGKKTRKVHVYGKKWDALAPGYEGVR